MKSIIICLVLIASTCMPAHSQEQDATILSAYYLAHFKLCEENKNEITEEKVLDVGYNSYSFYGRWQRKREEITDSVISAGGSYEEVLALTMEYPSPRQFYGVFTNYPEKGRRVVTDQIIKRFHYEEDVDTITWSLLACDTTILGYSCQKATCYYRNHHWEVYYTPEIPISAGPWKLCGLPGLILYASDDTGVFSFECIEIKNREIPLPQPTLSNSLKCNREDIKSMQKDMFTNPEEFAKRFGASGKSMDAHGRKIIYQKKTAVFID